MMQSSIRRYLRHGTLPQMSVFEAVARLGSFTRAGEELYLAQPTVSVQMKKLSETVGAPLFEQVGKAVHLTEAGRILYEGCDRMFATLGEMDDRLAALRGLKSGRLRLAVTTAAKYFAPRLLGAYSRAYPGIDISLQIHNRQVLMERLAANADDLYVFSHPPTDAEVFTEPLLPNPLVVYAPLDHPLAGAGRVPFATIAREPFLMREPGSGTHMAVQAMFEARGLEPLVRMELSTNEAIKQGILAGLGLSILPRHTFGIGTDPTGFAILEVDGLPMDEQWHLVYAKGKHLGGIPKSFIDFAHAEASALATA